MVLRRFRRRRRSRNTAAATATSATGRQPLAAVAKSSVAKPSAPSATCPAADIGPARTLLRRRALANFSKLRTFSSSCSRSNSAISLPSETRSVPSGPSIHSLPSQLFPRPKVTSANTNSILAVASCCRSQNDCFRPSNSKAQSTPSSPASKPRIPHAVTSTVSSIRTPNFPGR